MKPYKSDLQVMPLILVISGDKQDHEQLQAMLVDADWRLRAAANYRQALAALQRIRPAVVLCEASLPDGNWKDILSQTAGMPDAPLLVVISGCPDDRLWAEVLNLGGYDVLAKPLAREEVLRVLGLAGYPALKAAAGFDC